MRCPAGPAIFRAQEHMQRLLDSAKIYRIDRSTLAVDDLVAAMAEVVQKWRLAMLYPADCPCEATARPALILWLSTGGLHHATIRGANIWPGRRGVDVCVSSWTRLAPNTLAGHGKGGRELHEFAADQNGS